MPFDFMSPAIWMKPGRWVLWQVGVKAPGTANSTTFLPPNTSAVVIGFGPSGLMVLNVASGSLSPTLMAMMRVLPVMADTARAGCAEPRGAHAAPPSPQL